VLEPNGEVVGLFVPTNLERGKRLYDEKGSDIDWAEIERRDAQEAGQGTPLYEIFEHFKTLTADPEVLADLQQRIERLRAEDGCDTPLTQEVFQNLHSPEASRCATRPAERAVDRLTPHRIP
jgi:hypothetical protein